MNIIRETMDIMEKSNVEDITIPLDYHIYGKNYKTIWLKLYDNMAKVI